MPLFGAVAYVGVPTMERLHIFAKKCYNDKVLVAEDLHFRGRISIFEIRPWNRIGTLKVKKCPSG